MNSISDVKQRLRQKTVDMLGKSSIMLSAPEQCEHMKFCVQISNARRGIEVGVFTGYSALCMAEGLPVDGKLVALDVSSEWT